MGCFSWMFADANNTRPLLIGAPAYVACPSGDFIFESAYGGYGMFGGHDIYDLVVDWNREDIKHLVRQNQHHPLFNWSDEFLNLVMESDVAAEKYIADRFPVGHWLRRDWKRNLGIDIACYDDQNQALRYPIKITTRKDTPYSELPPSLADEGQGFGYIDEEL